MGGKEERDRGRERRTIIGTETLNKLNNKINNINLPLHKRCILARPMDTAVAEIHTEWSPSLSVLNSAGSGNLCS